MPRRYTDQRVAFTRVLWDAALKKARNVRFKGERRQRIAALVSVALQQGPLTSAWQAGELHRVGDTTVELLRDERQLGKYKQWAPPPPGCFASAAEALLVALAEAEEDEGPGALTPGAALIAAAARKLEPEREMLPADQLFPPDDARVCVAWEQMAPLVKGTWSGDRDSQLVVERSRKKACPTTGTVYSLTEAGRAMAARISAERSSGAAPPIYRSLHPAHVKEGLLLLVDAREGGGEDTHLLKIVRALRKAGLPFETRSLREGLGDYAFVHRRREPPAVPAVDGEPTDYLVPRLIERKTLDDLKASMRDGRWGAQRENMDKMAKRVKFACGGCEKLYLLQGVEGNMRKMRFKCSCGCVGFGGCCVDKNASQDSQGTM